MFFIGGFSTYLPYLILAITSFAGVAGFSLGIFNSAFQKSTPPEKIVEINEVSEQSFSDDVCNYYDFQDDNKTKATVLPANILAFIHTQKLIQFQRKKEIFNKQEQYYTSLFLRPPPTV